MIHSLTNLAITQLGQVTVLIIVAALLHRLLAARAPRLMVTVWTVVAVKAVTPPLFSSPVGVFSWAQAPAVGGTRPTEALLTVDWAGGSVGAWAAGALLVWAGGAVVVLTTTLVRRARLSRLIQRDALASDDPLTRYTIGLAERYELTPPTKVVVSKDEFGPAVCGVFRPVVLLPESLVADRDPATLRPVLLHELVHTTRRDTLTALLYTAMRIVWWFNPLVWWASRQAEGLVERCVDLTVTRDLQTGLVEYGRGLLRVLELRARLQPHPELASLRPCQITTERLNFLRDANAPSLRLRSSEWFAGLARRCVFLGAAAVLLPALPVDALTTRCDAVFTQACPLEAAHRAALEAQADDA